MRDNLTKRALRDGKTVFGVWVRFPDPTLVEVVAYQGWDFIVFDGEHGTLEPRECENLVRSAELLDVTPMVRVPANQPHLILRLLDTGVQGCHVPWIRDAADADAAVRAVKYEPRGERGLANARAAGYGQRSSLGEYVRKANEETLVVVQVETASAVAQVDEIAAVDGVDVVFLGPADLSQSLGVPGEMRHPIVLEHLERVAEATLAAGKALGVIVPDAEAARAWIERGATYVTTPLESLLAAGTRDYFTKVRG